MADNDNEEAGGEAGPQAPIPIFAAGGPRPRPRLVAWDGAWDRVWPDGGAEA